MTEVLYEGDDLYDEQYYEQDDDESYGGVPPTVPSTIWDDLRREDQLATIIDIKNEIDKLPEYEKKIVMAYIEEDPSKAADYSRELKPEITNRTVHLNRARKVFNNFLKTLKEKGITYP